MALEVILRRVPEESVRETDAADNWCKAQEWMEAVLQLTAQPDERIRLDQVPPFPLTSQELRALQASIDRIAQARAAASSSHIGITARHVRRSLGRLTISAYALGAALIVDVALTTVDVALFHEEASPWRYGLNLAVAVVAFAIWLMHFVRLGIHKSSLEKAHPLP